MSKTQKAAGPVKLRALVNVPVGALGIADSPARIEAGTEFEADASRVETLVRHGYAEVLT